MFNKKVLPAVVLLAWMPFFSAHAEEKEKAVEGVVDFKNTLGAISRLHKQGEYEQAFDQIQRARQRPLGTSELVTLSLYEGIILYEMGRHVESGDAFEMALLIRHDVKLPVQVAPKIENHFGTFRRRVQQELSFEFEARQGRPGTSGASPAPSTSVSASPECPPARMAAKGRTLKAQQLWRLASMERMLCARGIRGGEVAETLSALKVRVTEAGTGTEWMRLGQDLDRFAHKFAVYPSTEDWRQAKSSVPEELWELGDEDQDVPLPEAPVASAVSSQPQEEPANLFGCRAAVVLECDRLMRRLLLLQNQTLDMDAATRVTARKELYRLGQRIREASSNETLDEVSDDIDAWQGRWP
ncbi:hypothetical protein [Archangium sp.]|uniref:hypothetical protein n=1 Tax=Archangium sp. TaxID=1872627 RepID=UPI002D2811E4|nr:hypothetical protein [Archangium sp.]HYO58385.1 hypothetical protein [Archangium sp.]